MNAFFRSWYAKKLLCILLFSGLIIIARGQSDYSDEWKAIDASGKKDLPAEQIKLCREVFQKAARVGDYDQLIKAFNKEVELSVKISWKNADSIFSKYNALKPYFIQVTTDRASASLPEGVLIYQLNKLYLSYKYYYTLSRAYTGAEILQEEEKNWQAVLDSADLSKIAVSRYASLFHFPDGPFSEIEYPSTTFQILALRMKYYHLFRQILDEKVHHELLQQIAGLEKKAGNIRNYFYTQKVWLRQIADPALALVQVNGMLDTLSGYKKEAAPVKEEQGNILYAYGWDLLWKNKRSDSLLNRLEGYFQQAYRIAGERVRQRLADKTFQVSSNTDHSRPGKEVQLIIESLNIREFTYRIYKGTDITAGAKWESCGREKKVRIPSRFGIPDRLTVPVTFDTWGIYKVVCKVPGIKKEAFIVLCVSDLVLAGRSFQGRPQLFAADYKTGKPIGQAEIDIFIRKANEKRVFLDSSICKTILSFDGFTFLPGLGYDRKEPLYVNAAVGPDRYFISNTFHLFSDRIEEDKTTVLEKTALFPDRTLYRPGDTIRIKGVLYAYDRLSQEMLASEGKEAKVILWSPEYKKVDSVLFTSNDFGSFAGEMVVPAEAQLGRYHLTLGKTLTYININEYSKVNYTILLPLSDELLRQGDTLRQRVRVENTAGFPAAGKKIICQINGARREMVLDENGETLLEFDTRGQRPSVLFQVEYLSESGVTFKNYVRYTLSDRRMRLHYSFPEIVLVGDTTAYPVYVVNHASNRINLPVRYLLTGPKRDTVLTGVLPSGKAINWGILESGAYKIQFTSEYKDEVAQVEKQIYLIRETDSILPMTQPCFIQKLQTEKDSIVLLYGTTCEQTYPLIEIFGEKEGQMALVDCIKASFSKGLQKVRLPYKKEYPNEIFVCFSQVSEGRLHVESIRNRRFERDKELFVSLKLRKDTLAPGEQGWIDVEVKDGRGCGVKAEVVLSAFDKTTERFRANNYEFDLSVYRWNFLRKIPVSVALGMPWKNWTTGQVYGRKMLEEVEEEELPLAVNSVGGTKLLPDSTFPERWKMPEKIRRNLNETAFFRPFVRTDSNGRARVFFQGPELLGTFKIEGAVHTKEMAAGVARSQFISGKPVMILPNTPRFLREGDLPDYRAEIANPTRKQVQGIAAFSLEEHSDSFAKQTMVLPPGEAHGVVWPQVAFADTLRNLTFLTAFTGNDANQYYEDAQQETIPVYSDNMRIIRSMTLPLLGRKTHVVDYKKILPPGGAIHPVVEYRIGSPLDMAVKALPSVRYPECENLVELTIALYANAVLKKMGRDSNDCLQETIIHKIRSMQDKSGGLAWFKGFGPRIDLHLFFLERVAWLRQMGAIELSDPRIKQIVRPGVNYLDRCLESLYNRYKNSGSDRIWQSYLRYLYVRSYYIPEMPLEQYHQAVLAICVGKNQQFSLIDRVFFCNILLNMIKSFPELLLENLHSLLNYAVQDPELGTYYPNLVLPFRGLMGNELKCHAQLLSLFTRVLETKREQLPAETATQLAKIVSGLQQWLLMQKKNQQWEDNLATIDAVHALLYNTVKLEGGISRKDSLVQYRVTGFGKNDELRVEQKTPGLLFCSVYSTYEQKSNEVEAFENGLRIEREFYCNGKKMNKNTSFSIKIGDKISVKYFINNAQIRSFVRMTAHRAACLSPVSEYSGYIGFSPGFKYYIESKKEKTEYYFETLADGRHVLREEFVVTQSGEFNGSIVEIESLYSGDIRGNTPAVRIISGAAE